jgi:hypothetical protein
LQDDSLMADRSQKLDLPTFVTVSLQYTI